MSNSELLIYQVYAAVPGVLMCAYATYWAFMIRRRLAVRLYRNQALGVGLIALGVALAETLAAAMSYAIGQSNPGPLISPPAFFLFIMTFYWIDASVLAARRSDPLLRDTLHWRRLRIVLWAVLIVAVSINLVGLAFILPLILQVYLNQAAASSLAPSTLLSPFSLLLLSPFFLPVITGIVVIPAVARRSGDFTFRRHLRWFGGFAVSLIPFLAGIVLAISGPQTPSLSFLAQITIEISFALGGYALYRSAKALVPLNRISSSDSA